MDLATQVAIPARHCQATAARYAAVRAACVALAAPLSPEDAMLQSMADASPAKWHLAHTTWFFEHFVLAPAGLEPLQPHWHYLFHSYYVRAGPRHTPVHGRLQTGQVAPGPHHLLLRALRAGPGGPGAAAAALALPVQQLLRQRRPAPAAAAARAAVAAVAGCGAGLARGGGRARA